MKFAHISDCHLGSWRQPQMRLLNLKAFEKAIDKCIFERVDFILLVGDFFDTAIPPIEILKSVASKLRQLREKNISCYIIPGSHDYSFSGKSMISVLESAGLCVNLSQKQVMHGNILLYGIAGRKGGLEQQEIKRIKELKKEKKISSILLLHTSVFELLPEALAKQMPSLTLKELPSGFDYYALGHIHSSKIFDTGEKTAAYPGVLYPSNFSELEQQHTVNFFIVEKDKENRITEKNIRKISFPLKKILNLDIDANNENPHSLKEKILAELKKNNLEDTIITLRIRGILRGGKPSEVDFALLEEKAKESGAFCLLRNTSQFSSKEFEIKIHDIDTKNIEEIEEASLEEAVKEGIITEIDKKKFPSFVKVFNVEKIEGETSSVFASRLIKEAIRTLKLEELWR